MFWGCILIIIWLFRFVIWSHHSAWGHVVSLYSGWHLVPGTWLSYGFVHFSIPNYFLSFNKNPYLTLIWELGGWTCVVLDLSAAWMSIVYWVRFQDSKGVSCQISYGLHDTLWECEVCFVVVCHSALRECDTWSVVYITMLYGSVMFDFGYL